MVAGKIKKATQVNLDKTSGGVRPLKMFEESLSAIEGPVASRKNQARLQWPTGNIYPPSTISGKIKHRAAGQVLEIDALVFEDSIKHKKQDVVFHQNVGNSSTSNVTATFFALKSQGN